MINCRCCRPIPKYDDFESLESYNKALRSEFMELMKNCPAMKIYLPDELVEKGYPFGKSKETESPIIDAAGHLSTIFNLYCFGTLPNYTLPVHRFLLDDNGEIKPEVTKQYRKDYRETWINNKNSKGEFKKDYKRCQDLVEKLSQKYNYKHKKDEFVEMCAHHHYFQIYYGKIVEILLAYMLENNGYHIDGLAALASCPAGDILANKDNKTYHIEVKYIGIQNEEFLTMQHCSLDKRGFSIGPYKYLRYFVGKIREAAEQLKKFTKSDTDIVKIAAIVFHPDVWDGMKIALSEKSKIYSACFLQELYIKEIKNNMKYFCNATDRTCKIAYVNEIEEYCSTLNDLLFSSRVLDAVWAFKVDARAFEFQASFGNVKFIYSGLLTWEKGKKEGMAREAHKKAYE